MTKWRLCKGDDQLDFTYRSAPIPHHISDQAMSELAVCIYKVPPRPLLPSLGPSSLTCQALFPNVHPHSSIPCEALSIGSAAFAASQFKC